jgi:hypothetical protein
VGYYPRELVTAGSIRSTIERAHNLVNECYRDFSPIDLAHSIPELPFHGAVCCHVLNIFLIF